MTLRTHQAAIVPRIKIATLSALACAAGAIACVYILGLLFPERPLWLELATVAAISAAIAFPFQFTVCRLNDELRQTRDELRHALRHETETNTLSANEFAASVDHAIDRRRVTPAEIPDGVMLVLRVGNLDEIGRLYGPHWVDTLLQSLVRIVHSSVRYGDLVARLASDEIGIYLPGASPENARDICARIRARIGEAAFAVGQERQISVSVQLGGTRVEDRADFQALREAANRAALAEEEAGPLLVRELFS